jgi:hypothetical protein
MSSDNCPIHWNPSSRPNEHFVIRCDIPNLHVDPRSASADGSHTWQQVDEMLNGLAASTNRKAFQDLCNENEESDDKSRKKFAYRQSCDDCDGHGELHRHTALGNIFVGFMKNGKPPTIVQITPTATMYGFVDRPTNHIATAAEATNKTRAISCQANGLACS